MIETDPLDLIVASNMYPGPEGPYYGVFVERQVHALRRLGARVRVVAIDDPRKGRLRSPLKYARFFLELGREIALNRPDVVHFHFALPTAALGPALARARLPYVVTLHGGDVYAMPDRIPGGRALLRATLTRAEQIIVVGDQLGADLRERVPRGLPPVSVINMGVDTDAFALDEPSPLERVVFVGQLIHRKGVDLLLRAVAERPNTRLDIVGDGPERPSLEALASKLGLGERARFLGRALPDEVPARLSGNGIMVVPSRSEPLGLVALEGMARGCVVVAARTGGLAQLIDDGTNGFSFEPDDARSLRDALETAQSLSDEARAQLVETARAFAEENSVLRSAQKTLSVLTAAVGR